MVSCSDSDPPGYLLVGQCDRDPAALNQQDWPFQESHPFADDIGFEGGPTKSKLPSTALARPSNAPNTTIGRTSVRSLALSSLALAHSCLLCVRSHNGTHY